jgi:predicted amidophosphoribosyltransferase
MAFCHECGNPIIPLSAKFCRNCGASQLEEAQQATMPALATSPVSAPAPVAPVRAPEIPPPPPQSQQAPPVPPEAVMRLLCSSCGSPLGPDEKFCGICGSPAGEHPLPTPPAPEISAPARVSVCASCGSPLTEKGKFCGVCGASVNSVNSPPPLFPPISFDTPSAQQPSHPPRARLCRSCGNPIKPGDKFCSKCLAKVVDDSASASEPLQAPAPLVLSPPPPLFTPAPSPPPAQPSGIRLCRSCGNPITPGDKFCSKCLAKVADDSPVPHVQYPPPAARLQPLTPPASLLVCASCGSPITGTEKFCGICGTPVLFTSPSPSAPPQPVGKTCTTCGAPVSAMTKFCGSCGVPIDTDGENLNS